MKAEGGKKERARPARVRRLTGCYRPRGGRRLSRDLSFDRALLGRQEEAGEGG
jgi:hypothetical protein